MNFIEKLRHRLHGWFLKKDLARQPVRRSSSPLESAEAVGILFDGTEPEEREVVLGYAERLRQEGKKVKLLAFFNNRLDSGSFTFKHFNRKQLDWALRPKKSRDAEEFAGHPFDLLLNLSTSSVAPLEYLAACSRARFRVGPLTEKTFCYDLMIDLPGRENDLKAFLQQVVFYLKKLRPEKVAAGA